MKLEQPEEERIYNTKLPLQSVYGCTTDKFLVDFKSFEH